jgi:hypothetical protein
MRRSSFLVLLALALCLLPPLVRGQNPITTVAGGGLPTLGAAYGAAEHSSSTIPFGETERENQVDFCSATNLGIPGESKNES